MKKSAILFFTVLVTCAAFAQTVQDGMKDLYAERYQSAQSIFEKLTAANPNNIEATYWLGQTYIANGDVNGAKAIYDKALASSNKAPLILVGEGHVNLLQGKQNEARQLFETAINTSHRKKGNDAAVLTAIGRAITETYSDENKTDLDYAIAKLTEASQLSPNNPDIWFNLGNAYRKKHDGSNAVQAYAKAGNFAPAQYRIGMIYESQHSLRQPNDWDIVLQNYNNAVATDPRFAPAYLRLYNYYLFGKQDFSTAESYANKYVSASDPGVENTYIQAQTKFVQQQYNDAINIGKNIIAQSKGNPRPRVYRLLANSYMRIKDTATACQYANDFLSKSSADDIVPSDYFIHAQACGKGNPDVILADINKAREKDPEQAATVLKEALEDAKASGDKLLEGELSLILYQMQGANANAQNLVAIGVDFYAGGNLTKADSLFQAYNKAYPDSIYGYYWDSRLKAQIDSNMSQGLAVPQYEQALRVAAMDTSRAFYKSVGVSAAGYLTGYYNNIKSDRATALSYIEKGLAIDPTNATLLKYKQILSPKQPAAKTTTGSGGTATKKTKGKGK